MTDEFHKALCDSKHDAIKDRLDHHHKWLAEHEEKIDQLDRSDAKNTQAIDNLCEQMSGLTKAIWGLVSIVATALVGFFMLAAQRGLIK